mgnify:CR=1 FL=1
MKDKEIIYFRESLLQSVLSDTNTFGIIVLSFWLNYKFIGNNNFVNAILLIILIITINLKAINRSKIFTSKEDLIKYLIIKKIIYERRRKN